jgi:hypothetical protein
MAATNPSNDASVPKEEHFAGSRVDFRVRRERVLQLASVRHCALRAKEREARNEHIAKFEQREALLQASIPLFQSRRLPACERGTAAVHKQPVRSTVSSHEMHNKPNVKAVPSSQPAPEGGPSGTRAQCWRCRRPAERTSPVNHTPHNSAVDQAEQQTQAT